MELFGVPEYDPEAHGTDVTVKSVPNVPNTDWLEVYYDAKDMVDGSTTVNDLKPTGTAVNGTVAGNTSVTDGAFTFDGSGDYILSGNTSLSGTPTITYSVWFKTNSIDSSGSNSIVLVGYSGNTNSLGFRIEASGYYRFFVYGGSAAESQTTDIKPELGKWVHATITFNSGTGQKLYLNGQHVRSTFSTTTALNLAANSKVILGNYLNSSDAITGTASYDGSIANFRLFNRALTPDEIYQLYAYQKEYFGHGDLGMTLKAGRLGIGTSDPQAALDVRGTFQGNSSLRFFVINGIHPSPSVALPQGLIGNNIVSITGVTFNTNGDIVPFERHSESGTWEVDVYFNVNQNKIVMSSQGSACTSPTPLRWKMFVVST